MLTKTNRNSRWLLIRSCVLILMLAPLPSCSSDSSSPSEPPPPDAQPPEAPVTGEVTIFERANFGGQGYTLRGSISDLSDILGPCNEVGSGNWSECISSIQVTGGYSAILYERDGFNGDVLPVPTSISNLDNIPGCGIGDWDNCAQSIFITAPGAAATGGQ